MFGYDGEFCNGECFGTKLMGLFLREPVVILVRELSRAVEFSETLIWGGGGGGWTTLFSVLRKK